MNVGYGSSCKRQGGASFRAVLIWAAFSVVISVWREAAHATVQIAELCDPPGTVNVVVSHAPNDVAWRRMSDEYLAHWDFFGVVLARMKHLLVNEKTRETVRRGEIRRDEAALGSYGHSMGGRSSVIPNANAQIVVIDHLILNRDLVTVHRETDPALYLRVEEYVFKRDIRPQVLLSGLAGIRDEIPGLLPQSPCEIGKRGCQSGEKPSYDNSREGHPTHKPIVRRAFLFLAGVVGLFLCTLCGCYFAFDSRGDFTLDRKRRFAAGSAIFVGFLLFAGSAWLLMQGRGSWGWPL